MEITEWIRQTILAGAPPQGDPVCDAPDAANMAWDCIAPVARQEGVAGLLYSALRAQGRLATVPPAAAHALRSAYFQTLAATTIAVAEGVGVQQAWAAAGVRSVAMKGLALASTIYTDAGHRPLGDLDLLVAATDVATAEHTLAHLGYAVLPHYAQRGPHAALAERGYLRTTPPRVQLDLHHAPWSRPAVNAPALSTWLWAHTATVTTPAGPLRTFDATGQLLHVALHAAFQDARRGRLIRHYDLARLLATTTPDWRDLAAIARTAHIAPALAEALRAAAATWAVALPAGTEALAQPAWPARARCALLGVRAPAMRWLVDGLALGAPRATLAAWVSVLAPDARYRAWRHDVKRRRR